MGGGDQNKKQKHFAFRVGAVSKGWTTRHPHGAVVSEVVGFSLLWFFYKEYRSK